MSDLNKLFILFVFLLGIFLLLKYAALQNPVALMADKQLKQRIGQMLLVGFRGTQAAAASSIVKTLNGLNVGGVILMDYDVPSKTYGRNIVSYSQTKQLITNLQKNVKVPLLVAVDAEGGLVNRLKPSLGFLDVPSVQQMGQQTASNTLAISQKLGQQLVDLGFNFNLAPVVDVNVNKQNPVIGKIGRSFSSNPQVVAQHAAAFILGMRQNKIITSLKHFPGHGSSRSDSHLGLVDVTGTYQEQELIPYTMLLEQGLVDTVMTAHIVNKNIDPNLPATLSPNFVQNILRKQLGFGGVVVSDDLQMGAIMDYYGLEQAAVKAVLAGCDLLIISNNVKAYDAQAPAKVYNALLEAVENGVIPQGRIVEASNQIASLKKQFGVIK
jgi:beta-N-acetylhexosaminidase